MIELEIQSMFIKTAAIGDVFWGIAPPNAATPRIHLHMVSQEGDHDFDGPIPLKMMAVQVDIITRDLPSALALKKKLTALDGEVGTGTIRDIFIDRMRLDADGSNAAQPFYRYSIDFDIYYTEASE